MSSRKRMTVTRNVTRVSGSGATREEPDALAVEEPLEIRIAGETLAITMRTPGQDRELAVGFAFAEGVLTTIDDLGSVRHCGRQGDEGADNTIDMLPAPGAHLDPDIAARETVTTAACGVCGRRTIDDLLLRCRPLQTTEPIHIDRLRSAIAALGNHQPTFDATGGSHAATLLDAQGAVLTSAEDVGRHNAVDKVVGDLLLARRLGRAAILVVSGRTSFEIVQKATVASVPFVVGVSAPTSLAVELAQRMGIALAGFARDDALNLYTHGEHVDFGIAGGHGRAT